MIKPLPCPFCRFNVVDFSCIVPFGWRVATCGRCGAVVAGGRAQTTGGGGATTGAADAARNTRTPQVIRIPYRHFTVADVLEIQAANPGAITEDVP